MTDLGYVSILIAANGVAVTGLLLLIHGALLRIEELVRYPAGRTPRRPGPTGDAPGEEV